MCRGIYNITIVAPEVGVDSMPRCVPPWICPDIIFVLSFSSPAGATPAAQACGPITPAPAGSVDSQGVMVGGSIGERVRLRRVVPTTSGQQPLSSSQKLASGQQPVRTSRGCRGAGTRGASVSVTDTPAAATSAPPAPTSAPPAANNLVREHGTSGAPPPAPPPTEEGRPAASPGERY